MSFHLDIPLTKRFIAGTKKWNIKGALSKALKAVLVQRKRDFVMVLLSELTRQISFCLGQTHRALDLPFLLPCTPAFGVVAAG